MCYKICSTSCGKKVRSLPMCTHESSILDAPCLHPRNILLPNINLSPAECPQVDLSFHWNHEGMHRSGLFLKWVGSLYYRTSRKALNALSQSEDEGL